MNDEIRERVARQMVEAIQQDLPPWRQPWGNIVQGLPCNAATKKPYQGINRLLLMSVANQHGYTSPYWATTNAWERLKAKSLRREKPVRIVFFGIFAKKNKKTKAIERYASGREKTSAVWREFSLFNLQQVAITKQLAQKLSMQVQPPDFEPAEQFLSSTGADIRHGGLKAFYRPSEGFIQLPHKSQFDSMADYYETAFHELIHFTKCKVKRHENEYEYEELVAEIGACILLATLRVPMADQMLESSKRYVNQWLQGMKADPRLIFNAAADADRAIRYLTSLTPAMAT